MSLSARAHETAKPDPKFLLWDILKDTYDAKTNPDGYISLGVAENTLMHETLSEYIHNNIAVPTEDFTYGDGKKRLRATLARFLTRHLKPQIPIEPAHVSVTNGVSSAVEHLSWALGNPGDGFLLGKPFYGTFVPDLTLRMGTHLLTVEFGDNDPLGLSGVQQYEEKILAAKEKGQTVAGLIIAHPHNPLGRCYPRKVLIELMKLCQKYQIHFISDEIYALSTFENTVDDVEITKFESALSIDSNGIIDPERLHVLWGISKDFGANGLRLGAIVSQNPELHAAIVPASIYSSSSAVTDNLAIGFLGDDTWVDEYVSQNRSLLKENYEYITRWAKHYGIEYAPGVNAAFFLWVNLGKAYMASHDVKGDLDEVIMAALLKEKVFLAAGSQFGSEKPGWFRIVFSHKRNYLDMGLHRIVAAIAEGDEQLSK